MSEIKGVFIYDIIFQVSDTNKKALIVAANRYEIPMFFASNIFKTDDLHDDMSHLNDVLSACSHVIDWENINGGVPGVSYTTRESLSSNAIRSLIKLYKLEPIAPIDFFMGALTKMYYDVEEEE